MNYNNLLYFFISVINVIILIGCMYTQYQTKELFLFRAGLLLYTCQRNISIINNLIFFYRNRKKYFSYSDVYCSSCLLCRYKHFFIFTFLQSALNHFSSILISFISVCSNACLYHHVWPVKFRNHTFSNFLRHY